ncbi:Nitrite transporter NirC [Defluviimonas aquaemixtae]|uniref:Nitrite transporter NirC n=1 Tax=Albidovulum aquaemixtae TaxID=1542388 RepID=A0A2R8BM12_9RHOB|nr:formate/nitrite transporter family protein [Defluviimonas aquaemixtae]SPH24370.1 Nitrite transporter NirC [Defluviimonas aquaemixtae]
METVGALAVAFGLVGLFDGSMGATAAAIASANASLPAFRGFIRAALCNALVCLTIWLTFAARTTAGKILAILRPITGLVLLDLEHSVANTYFFPRGWAAGAELDVPGAAANPLWVTRGNILGGAGGDGRAYRFAYLGPAPRRRGPPHSPN